MKVILTGGGTAGHITPNLALVPELRRRGCEIDYIGGHNGMEQGLAVAAGLKFHGISAGKLRRYLSAKNISDSLRVVKGLKDAVSLMRKLKPDAVFSKGGFVTVPVVIAAKLCRVPVVVHESDLSPGLANRISSRFSGKVCVSFPETARHFGKKAVVTGAPIRADILSGDRRRGLELCGFDGGKPVVLVMGGSQGSRKINGVLRESLNELMKKFSVVHLCGKGNTVSDDRKGYRQFEYLRGELADVFACSDVIISRAGANSIFEFLALKKPSLLIPLSLKASRGDQIDNARLFAQKGFSQMMDEEALTPQSLQTAVSILYDKRDRFKETMAAAGDDMTNGVSKIIDLLMTHGNAAGTV